MASPIGVHVLADNFMQLNFKNWISESVFPDLKDLSEFLSHAATICIRTHQAMSKLANVKKNLIDEISDLGELLQHVHQKLENKIPNEPFNMYKFQSKPSPLLNKPQYSIKYPTLESLIPVLRTIGGNPAIDRSASKAISDQIQSVLIAWN